MKCSHRVSVIDGLAVNFVVYSYFEPLWEPSVIIELRDFYLVDIFQAICWKGGKIEWPNINVP